MQYLMMCCFDKQAWEDLPEVQRDSIMVRIREYQRELVDSEPNVAAAQSGTRATATTVRIENGQPAITDGPIAETREAIGGYHTIECRNLDEAMVLARRLLTLPVGGTVEVRPMEQATDRFATD
jgi:hypothetical protein